MNILVLGVIGYLNHRHARESALEQTILQARSFAAKVRSNLQENVALTKSVAYSVRGLVEASPKLRRDVSKDLLFSVLDKNEEISAMSLFWELNALDSTYISPYGRISSMYYRGVGKLSYSTHTLDLESEDISSPYYLMKSTGEPFLTSPAHKQYERGSATVFNATVSFPIFYKNNFVGSVETDLNLEQFRQIAIEAKPHKKAYTFVLSSNGAVVTHKHDSLLNSNIALLYPRTTAKHELLRKIRSGESATFVRMVDGQPYFYSVEPVLINDLALPWAVGVALPMQVISETPLRNLLISFGVGIIGMLIMTTGVYLIVRRFITPLRLVSENLSKISDGESVEIEHINTQSPNEIELIYQAMTKLLANLREKIIFARELSSRNYENKFVAASEDDELGFALIELKENLLLAAKEENQRRQVDERLSWASRGYNAYGELTSKFQQNFEHFTKETIVWLTKYTEMAIGGLYLIERKGNEQAVRLYASHNYNRENKRRRKIPFGQGLVGRCAQENETIYLSDIPESYIKISSGLGEDTAKYLLLVPLRLNQDAFGVIELASFVPIADYRIEFVEKVGENIAATVMNIRANTQTAELLSQQKRQTNEMLKKELLLQEEIETLKKNHEKTLENYEKQKFSGDVYFKNMAAVEIHIDGEILRCNDRFELMFGYKHDEIHGKNILDLTPEYISYDLKVFVNHILEKRGLRRELVFADKMKVKKTVLSYWSIINHKNDAWIVIHMVDISQYKMLDEENNRLVVNLKKEIESLKNEKEE